MKYFFPYLICLCFILLALLTSNIEPMENPRYPIPSTVLSSDANRPKCVSFQRCKC